MSPIPLIPPNRPEPVPEMRLSGSDPKADREALRALVDWQAAASAPPVGAVLGEAELAAPLARLRARCTATAAQAAWDRPLRLLAGSAAAQPVLALHPALSDRGQGPLTHDIAALLAAAGLDEPAEIDLAVRWWQLARAAGLPVHEDFGETWRAIEWMALWLHLAALADAAPGPSALPFVQRVALRYAPLAPLLRLLQPLTGAAPEAGFTF